MDMRHCLLVGSAFDVTTMSASEACLRDFNLTFFHIDFHFTKGVYDMRRIVYSFVQPNNITFAHTLT